MAEPKPTEAPAAGGSREKLIIIAVVVSLALVGVGVGVTFALTGGGKQHAEVTTTDGHADAKGAAGEGEEKLPKEVKYIGLDPAFVINFQDRKGKTKFLKAELSVVSSDPLGEADVKTHMPAIRNSLVMLLSRQVYDDLLPPEGKEKLRADALKEVQAVLTKQSGKPRVDDLFFSSFVMQ